MAQYEQTREKFHGRELIMEVKGYDASQETIRRELY